MAAKRFTVDLQRVGRTATSFRVPFDPKEAFGRARPPVKVTIRGHTWRTTPDARDAFARLSSSHRRESVQWVEEAKRPETRDRRVHGTIQRVPEGPALR